MVSFLPLGFTEPSLAGRVVPEFASGPGPVEYRRAWEIQRAVHADVVGGERDHTVLLLEHEPVYTAGKLTVAHERPLDGTPVIDVDRGGKITWHGPRQLVGYPIVALRRPIDVVGYVRRLEQALIRAIRAITGLDATTVEGRSGVWFRADGRRPDRKVCAIGVRVSRTTTMHGFALNCANDLTWQANIIPCGIADAAVTSLSAEAGRTIDVSDVLDATTAELTLLVEEVGAAPGDAPGRIRAPEWKALT